MTVDSCYVCTTPFQIINAITLTYYKKKPADLYIVPQFSGASEYCSRVKQLGLFRQVTVVETEQIEAYKKARSSILKYAGIVKNYLLIERIAKKIFLPDTDYERIFISSKANIGRLMCLYYIRRKKKAAFYYFDDGEGSYDNAELYAPRKGDAMIRKVLFGKRSLSLSDTIYLYSPELFQRMNPASSMRVRRIPSWTSHPELLQYINTVCNYTEEKKITQKVIFLDTICTAVFEPEQCSRYRKLRQQIVRLFGDDIIVKKHPRDPEPSECAVYPYKDVPFEVICANSDIGDKLLISLASTAVSMPKLLFDANASAVLLYRLIPPKFGDDRTREAFYQAIRDSYPEKERFSIPDSEEALFKICKGFSERSSGASAEVQESE